MILIGVDCATEAKKTGLACAELRRDRCRLLHAEAGASRPQIVERIAAWLPPSGPALIALDAPLGWPAALGEELVKHRAGEALAGEPNALFRRATDRFVKARVGQQPLDVGADRIARTATAALELLAQLRRQSHRELELAWQLPLREAAAIEVYPAATLRAHGITNTGYKRTDQHERRSEVLRALADRIEITAELRPALLADADVVDAALCILAALDFLRGRCLAPEDTALARQEGWIWVAAPAGPQRLQAG